MDMENKYASRGIGGTALGLAIGALGVEALRGNFGGILGGGNCCGESAPASREVVNKDMEIAYLRGRDAAKTDSLELYKYVDGRFTGIEAQLASQAVKNAQIEGTFAVLGEKISAQHNEFLCALNRERDERCCGDNSIVTYANATFYPKMVADITTGTTTTAQLVYNPLPCCGK